MENETIIVETNKLEGEVDMQLKQISITEVKPNPFQPREEFNKEELQELADNIKKHGLIEPIIVTPKGSGFMIVAGERRWRAHQLAGLNKIHAIIKTYQLESDIKRDSLIENELRENLTNKEFKTFAFELAKSLGEPYYINGFVNAYKLTEYLTGCHGTQKDTPLYSKLKDFFRIEKEASAKVKKLFDEDKIDRRTASQIASIEDKQVQNELADMAKHKSVTEIRQEVAKHNFQVQAQEIHEQLKQENNEKKKSASEMAWINKISTKVDSWDNTVNFAANSLQIANSKRFWEEFSQQSRLEAMDTLKPFKKDVERLLHIVTKTMETIGGI